MALHHQKKKKVKAMLLVFIFLVWKKKEKLTIYAPKCMTTPNLAEPVHFENVKDLCKHSTCDLWS